MSRYEQIRITLRENKLDDALELLAVERTNWSHIQDENGISADSERFLLLTSLNELLIKGMKEKEDYSAPLLMDLQHLLFRLYDLKNIPLDTKLCVLRDLMLFCGERGEIGNMNYYYTSVLHWCGFDEHQAEPLRFLHYLMRFSTEENVSRFISLLSCILMCSHHFQIECRLGQEAKSVLSSVATIVPLSPVIRLILKGDADPPSSLLYLFEDWWNIELYYRQKNYARCQTILYSFLQTHTNDAFFISYDLILLNIKTPLFIPLCQSFLSSLPSCPNCPFHLWFEIRPFLTSDCITLQQFFAYKLLLLLLEHAPLEGRMIRRALSFCGDREGVQEIKWIMEGSTDRTSVYGWIRAFQDAFNRCHWTEAVSAMREVDRRKRQCKPAVRALIDTWMNRNQFLLVQATEKEAVFREACAMQAFHTTRSRLLCGDVTDSTTIHLLNVCIALLRRGEVTRCCVIWSHYWEEDILMVKEERWTEERLKEVEKAMATMNENQLWRQMLVLDRYVLNHWTQLLQDRNVANEVAAMEANGVLFHMSVK